MYGHTLPKIFTIVRLQHEGREQLYIISNVCCLPFTVIAYIIEFLLLSIRLGARRKRRKRQSTYGCRRQRVRTIKHTVMIESFFFFCCHSFILVHQA